MRAVAAVRVVADIMAAVDLQPARTLAPSLGNRAPSIALPDPGERAIPVMDGISGTASVSTILATIPTPTTAIPILNTSAMSTRAIAVPVNRRTMMSMGATAVAATLLKGAPAVAEATAPSIKAVAFDGFALLDQRPVLALAKELYSDHGEAFVSLFQARLFEYQWLRALGGQYSDFLKIIDDAHAFSAEQVGTVASVEKLAALREAFLKIKAWPDAEKTLKSLKGEQIRLAFLSNMTVAMLNTGLKNSGLDDILEFVLSSDDIRTYKPDPRAYRLAVDAFGISKEEILFVASAGWDAAGATWFGYPTMWINRQAAKQEHLGPHEIPSGRVLDDVVRFVADRN